MAPHLTLAEQDKLLDMHHNDKTPGEIHAAHEKCRARQHMKALDITAVRKFLKGKTHRRSGVETRGRKLTYSKKNVSAMDRSRLGIIKKVKGTRQVRWDDIKKHSRVPKAHRCTMYRAFQREGLEVKLRRSREKPQRTDEKKEERKLLCGRMRRWPESRYTDDIDMITDCKMWPVATTPHARDYLLKQKVYGQLRTPQEGLLPTMTKPNVKRHRINPGGGLHVCAGISGGRVVVWEYYTRWNGAKAAEMYSGPILKALKKHRGVKASYLLAEDNDPTGYKSGKGMAAKQEAGIRTVPWPRYSPDLNPLDFTLWQNISRRMDACAPTGRETVGAYKIRLRRMALRTPKSQILSAVRAMKKRAHAIWEADGNDIARD